MMGSNECLIAVFSWLTLRWTPRRSCLFVSSAQPALDEVQPRVVGRREVHALRRPVANQRRLVSPVVLHEQVYVQVTGTAASTYAFVVRQNQRNLGASQSHPRLVNEYDWPAPDLTFIAVRTLVVQKLTRRITDRERSRTTNMMSDHIGGA
jgi:hypothetical protein